MLSVLQGLCTDLAGRPDFVLVEVENASERVRVEKKDGALHVSVDSGDESVRIEIPLASIAKVARWLERSAPAAAGTV